mmetsp:Transcript_25097/g.34587  ORF Transcript_25097/g.34587 Transcript_25097/m.34587 type:complete len:227 (+) Transcript_25097:104-784(+)|eukprot:CAMPEP_0196576994 /NCGR_PEP_ID=MMETSP1081-20130531/6142_1 /TAXON_ID=36882 /ORGANISM="Pyramimonas amylifera, Strain CCMP720" /LENGTH=226 /DNA_ID=CAMNT_0041895769 /DNA_START=105 /DNA_END=785 /DNA_ORIENTATION=-
MNDADYNRQIQQMVEFIKQEANEKSNEIRIAAEEEFNIQKLTLVEAEKAKIRKDYERKDGQAEVKKRIEYSTQLNASRLKLLHARDEIVTDVLASSMSKLGELSKKPKEYTQLLVKLIVQATLKLEADDVVVRCRKEDVSVCTAAIAQVCKEWSKLASELSLPKMVLDSETYLPAGKGDGKTCAGGVLVSAEGGRITCNNTLDARLSSAFQANLPLIRSNLFEGNN